VSCRRARIRGGWRKEELRWELSHLHEFELPDGRRIRFPDVDPEEHGWQDHDALRVAAELSPSDEFT
jgi:hypothetical protein